MGRAAVPSGASTGSREAIELRDGDKGRYLGKGVLKAVENVNTEISEAIIGLDANEQAFIDQHADRARRHREQDRGSAPTRCSRCRWPSPRRPPRRSGLPLYRYFGGCGAMQMPVPMMNVINGGAHANNNLDIQEFMIVPARRADASREALRCGAEVFHALKKLLDEQGHDHRGRRRGRLRART